MAQNKEQLNKVLLFIKRLVEEPGNEEFVNGLRNLLAVPVHNSADNRKLSDIEKYLGLDYKLDSAIPDIDYSFVDDDYVRERLNSDNREMLRYRYGLRGHKVDFYEVCRYAIFQEEMLINYFYKRHFSSMDDIKEYLCLQISKSYDGRMKGDKNIEEKKNKELNDIRNYVFFEQIPLATKQDAFSIENGKDSILKYARRIRNEISHRSPQEELNDIMHEKEYLEGLGVIVLDSGFIDSKQFVNKEKLKSKVYNDRRYWNFIYMVWKNKKSSDEVILSLKQFVLKIKNKI